MKLGISFVSSLTLYVVGSFLQSSPLAAQITPDGTTNTTVNADGNNFEINQGDRVGDNLFHSFEEFSVPTLGKAAFNNELDIANIFSRVTGSSISDIDGLISANGAANLYLINPNGIIFGENASLKLGGSFFASTADSLLFDNGLEFSASNPTAPPLIEVNIPIGLGFRNNPGEIVNRSVVEDIAGDLAGLEVEPGQNLTLVGGDIKFDRGQATARGGNIQLGGLSAAGTVGISDDGSLSFPEDVERADITLSNAAEVDVMGTGGGSITINAGNLTLKAGEFGSSFINAGIAADSTSVDAQAGEIAINATKNVTVDDGNIFNLVDSGAVGNAGNLTIKALQVSIRDGGLVAAATFGLGNAGNVLIRASEVDIFETPNNSSFVTAVFNAVGRNAIGNAGNLTIEAERLSIRDGAQVTADTFGNGNAGNISLRANDSVEVAGSSSRRPTFLVADVDREATGQGGNLTIETKRLSIRDGAQVATSTFGTGDAGSLTVRADEVEIFGSTTISSIRVTSGLFSQAEPGSNGSGGNLTIEARGLSVRDGARVTVSTFSVENAGNLTIKAEQLNISNSGQVEASTSDESTGDGGNIFIDLIQAKLSDRARIKVNSLGKGNGGDIFLTADSLTLGNISEISASTVSGEGGNIKLTIAEDIFFKNNSSISARAFENANGGNVTINANDGSIVAFPNQNNDIIANAEQGNGGNINITTQAIFGLEERPSTPANQTNDIDASSEFGLQGDFSLNTPENEPSRGLIDLPENVVNPEDLISQNACKQGGQSKFTLTGRGGLPATPEQVHHSDEVEVGLVEPAMGVAAVSKDSSVAEDSTKIEPARGWIRNEQGEVFLVGYDPTVSNILPQPENLDLCQPR